MAWNKNHILSLAKKIKASKATDSIKLNASTYKLSSCAFLLSRFIMDTKATNFEGKSIELPANSQGDSVNIKVMKNSYIDMNKRFYNYCNVNKKAPNFITVSGKKISFNLFAFCLAKIVIYIIENNNTFPNYCMMISNDIKKTTTTKPTITTQTSSSRFVSSPHLTTYSAGLGQDTPYYCACNSLQQSFYKLTKKVVKESTIASWAGTTSQGTGHSGINTAVAAFNRAYKTNLKIEWKSFSDFGSSDKERFKAIGNLIKNPNKAVFFHIGYHNGGDNLNGRSYGHYEMCDIINTDTSYVRALNSLGSKCSGQKYCGFLQNRKFNIQSGFIKEISQKSVCIITKN